MSTLLQLNNLEKRFGGIRAVDSVSFTLQAGEVVGLLGPNGSGKTTLLNTISGAHAATGGSITFAGSDITALRPDQIAKKGVARTFQLVRILPSMSVLENVVCSIAFSANAKWGEAARQKAIENLALVGLQGKEHLPAGSLNYIDSKRLELARALAADPQLLLLDEWLSGLTPAELEVGIELIRQIERKGITILIVEHIMSAIRALCPRCVVMNTGRKIADGKTDDVLKDAEVISAYLGDAHA